MSDYRTAKGWLTMAEREALFTWAIEVAPMQGAMLNIGIEFGASMHCLAEGSGLLVGVDLVGDEKMEGGPLLDTLIVKGMSQDLYTIWSREQPIKLAFVDGGHDYRTVMSDCRFAYLVCHGGIIAFHDTSNSPAEADVNRAVTEFAAEGGTGPSLGFVELPRVDSIRAFKRD